MDAKVLSRMTAVVLLMLAACGPTATATPQPTAKPAATATPMPTQPAASRATATAVPTLTPASTSATAAPKVGGTIRLAYDREARAWDPFQIVNADLHPWVQWSHNRLARFSRDAGCDNYPLVPELATSWKWTDDLTLEIKLRQGVKFPNIPPVNGREFVADDVLYSVNVQWPRTMRTYADRIDKATAPDKYTVLLRMKVPSAFFAQEGTSGWWNIITAPEVFGPSKQIQKAEENVGLGPYILKQYSPGVRLDYERNPNYWQKGLPYIDAISFSVIPDMATQAAALRSGRIDGLPHPQPEPSLQVQLGQVKGLRAYACPWGPFFAIRPTMEEGSPYRDVRVRRAMSMAIDREALNRSVYLGLGQTFYPITPPLYGPSSLAVDKLAPELRRYWEYHPDEAKRLLAEAGYPNGFAATLKGTNRYGHLHKALAEALAGMLQQVGIKANIEILDYGEFANTVTVGKYSGAALAYIGGDSAVWSLYHMFHTKGGSNYNKVSDPKLDALIDQFMELQDVAKSAEAAQEAQRLVISQMYSIPMPGAPLAGYFNDRVKGVNYKSHYMGAVDYMLYAWLDR